jgi:hypothetical protein
MPLAVLRRWFSLLNGRAGRDPYFLYAASNLGSLGRDGAKGG